MRLNCLAGWLDTLDRRHDFVVKHCASRFAPEKVSLGSGTVQHEPVTRIEELCRSGWSGKCQQETHAPRQKELSNVAVYSITSSARSNMDCGMLTPKSDGQD